MKKKWCFKKQKDPSFKAKHRHKGNSYTQQRSKLEEVLRVLNESFEDEREGLQDAKAQELVGR
jgi:hypothetical protein